MGRNAVISLFSALFIIGAAMVLAPVKAGAHCDTLEGPVVMTARTALERGDLTPVLKWIGKDDEGEIREQFKKTLVARKQGKESQELADKYFFETLVRIHRAGEGAPYTGLKSEPAEPIIQAADKALETGKSDSLVKLVTESAVSGIRERFAKVSEAKKHADESVAKGREFVEAYVDFTHYVERLHDAAAGSAPRHGEAPKMEERHHGEGHVH